MRLPSAMFNQRNWGCVGVFATGDDRLVVAVGCGHGADAGQATGEHLAVGNEVAIGPLVDCL